MTSKNSSNPTIAIIPRIIRIKVPHSIWAWTKTASTKK